MENANRPVAATLTVTLDVDVDGKVRGISCVGGPKLALDDYLPPDALQALVAGWLQGVQEVEPRWWPAAQRAALGRL